MIYFHSSYYDADNVHFNKPVIGYESVLRTTDFTEPTITPDHPPINLWSPDTASFWYAGANNSELVLLNSARNPFNYIGIARHNFYDAGIEFSVEVNVTGVGTWYEIISRRSVESSDPIFLGLAESYVLGGVSQVVDYAKVKIRFYQSGSTRAQIAHIKMGKFMRLERGIFVGDKPSSLVKHVDSITQVSESGQYLGRINRSSWRQAFIEQKNNSAEFVHTQLKNFIAHCNGTRAYNGTAQETFFYMPRPHKNVATGMGAQDIVYGWSKSQIVPENQSANGMMNWSMTVEAIA